jgi:hypothetical protein
MKIKLKASWIKREVRLNGKVLSPKRSLKIANHSPDGFNWGYAGSGPSQLALAICLELYGNSDGYQDFKLKYIATLPQADFDLELEVPDAKEKAEDCEEDRLTDLRNSR